MSMPVGVGKRTKRTGILFVPRYFPLERVIGEHHLAAVTGSPAISREQITPDYSGHPPGLIRFLFTQTLFFCIMPF